MLAPFEKMLYTIFVNLTKKLFFIYVAVFSLLNVAVQAQSFAFTEGKTAGKSEFKNYFLQAPQTQTVQRDDAKEKRQTKTYPPETLFFNVPLFNLKFVFAKQILKFYSTPTLNEITFSKSVQPRAPPVLS